MAEAKLKLALTDGYALERGRVERSSTVYTDGFRGYRRVSRLGYKHFSVRHCGLLSTLKEMAV